MSRREFITLIGGATAAWPLAARAQQPAVPVIGFLGSSSAQVSVKNLEAFRKGLSQTGSNDAKGRPLRGGLSFNFRTVTLCKANALSGLGLRYRALHSDRRLSTRTCDKPRLDLPPGPLNGPSLPGGERHRYPGRDSNLPEFCWGERWPAKRVVFKHCPLSRAS